jgi:hypothetical protein
MRAIFSILTCLSGSCLFFVLSIWGVRLLNSNEALKIHAIDCRVMSGHNIQCQHHRAGSLFEPATRTSSSRLRSASIETYQKSCGESGHEICEHLMLMLVTDDQLIQIKDFEGDKSRAKFQAERFKMLLNQSGDLDHVQLRYENVWYTVFLELLLLFVMIGVWCAVVTFILSWGLF